MNAMKKILFLILLTSATITSAQQRITIIDKNDQNAMLFDENKPNSLINLVNRFPFSSWVEYTPSDIMERSYITDADRKTALVNVIMEFVQLNSVVNPDEDSLIPALDENGLPAIVDGEHVMAVAIDSMFRYNYVDLTNISRILIYEGLVENPQTGEEYMGIKRIGFAKKYPGESKYDVVLKVPFDELARMYGMYWVEKIEKSLVEDKSLWAQMGESLETSDAPDSASAVSFYDALKTYQEEQFAKKKNGEPVQSAIYDGCWGEDCLWNWLGDDLGPLSDLPHTNWYSTTVLSSKKFSPDLSPKTDEYGWPDQNSLCREKCLMDSIITFTSLKSVEDPDMDSVVMIMGMDGKQMIDASGFPMYQVCYDTSIMTTVYWNNAKPSNYYVLYAVDFDVLGQWNYDAEGNSSRIHQYIKPLSLFITDEIDGRDRSIMGVRLNGDTPFHKSHASSFSSSLVKEGQMNELLAWRKTLYDAKATSQPFLSSTAGKPWSKKSIKKFYQQFNKEVYQFTDTPNGMMF
jgi:hypothetical protein